MFHTRLFAALTVTLVVFTGIGVSVAPRVAARYMTAQDQPDQFFISRGIGSDYAGPVIEVVPSIEIRAPRTIRSKTSRRISIVIRGKAIGHASDLLPGAEGTASDQPPKVDSRVAASYTVELSAPDDFGLVCAGSKSKTFDPYPSNLDPQTWYCSTHPKQPGDYEVFITGLPPAKDAGTSFAVHDVPEDDPGLMWEVGIALSRTGYNYERLPDGTVSLIIRVLTPLGFTAPEWAGLQAVGAVTGVLGTIFAFPFLKVWFDKPLALSAPIPPPEEEADRERKTKPRAKIEKSGKSEQSPPRKSS